MFIESSSRTTEGSNNKQIVKYLQLHPYVANYAAASCSLVKKGPWALQGDNEGRKVNTVHDIVA